MTGRLVIVCGLPGSGKTTLARALTAPMSAARMCPDDWMITAGIDLWDEQARHQIEQVQCRVTRRLLTDGRNVIIEWGTWVRDERDRLRTMAREVGAAVELRCCVAPVDVLWDRIVARNAESRFGSCQVTRTDLDRWVEQFEMPDSVEFACYDPPMI